MLHGFLVKSLTSILLPSSIKVSHIFPYYFFIPLFTHSPFFSQSKMRMTSKESLPCLSNLSEDLSTLTLTSKRAPRFSLFSQRLPPSTLPKVRSPSFSVFFSCFLSFYLFLLLSFSNLFSLVLLNPLPLSNQANSLSPWEVIVRFDDDEDASGNCPARRVPARFVMSAE